MEQNVNDSKRLEVFDPPMCCSSGVCGPSVDPALARFAGALNAVSQQPGVRVERYNLGQQPQAFVENPQVKELLADGGEKRLPFIFIDGRLWSQGRYPSRDELLEVLEIETETVPESGADTSCGGEGGCC